MKNSANNPIIHAHKKVTDMYTVYNKNRNQLYTKKTLLCKSKPLIAQADGDQSYLKEANDGHLIVSDQRLGLCNSG